MACITDVILSVDGVPTTPPTPEGNPSTACNCTYPLMIYKNGSGHAEDCPVQKAYRRDQLDQILKAHIRAGQF